jgi:hypothetical protein
VRLSYYFNAKAAIEGIRIRDVSLPRSGSEYLDATAKRLECSDAFFYFFASKFASKNGRSHFSEILDKKRKFVLA